MYLRIIEQLTKAQIKYSVNICKIGIVKAIFYLFDNAIKFSILILKSK